MIDAESMSLAAYTSTGLEMEFFCEVETPPWAAEDECGIALTVDGVDRPMGYGTIGYTLAEIPATGIRFASYSVTFSHRGDRLMARAGSVGEEVVALGVTYNGLPEPLSCEIVGPLHSFVLPIRSGVISEWTLVHKDGATSRVMLGRA